MTGDPVGGQAGQSRQRARVVQRQPDEVRQEAFGGGGAAAHQQVDAGSGRPPGSIGRIARVQEASRVE